MSLAPRLGTADDTKVVLSFDSGVTDLGNIDYQSMVTKVIHKVQADSDLLTQKAQYMSMKGSFKWIPLTGKRNPTKRTKAIPPIASTEQSFDNVGLVLSGYDDDSYIVEYVEKNSQISVSTVTFEAMYKGYRRLMSRLIMSAMVQPKIMKDTNTSSYWKNPESRRVETALPLTRIGGRVTGTGSNFSLATPNYATFQKLKRAFYDRNVPRSTRLCSVLTPRMEEIMTSLTQYQNRDYNMALMKDKINSPEFMSVEWMGIEWIKIEPEIQVGSVYNSNRFAVADGVSDLLNIKAGTVVTNDADLGDGTSSTTAYEVIPVWSPGNIVWASDPSMAMSKMYKVPKDRLVPVISMTEWLGATRVQDELIYNLIIPT